MQLIRTYNQPYCGEKAKNLIYFADKKAPEKGTSTAPLESIYLRKISILSEFADVPRIKPGQVDLETLRELADLVENPRKIGDIKDDKEDIKYRQYFMKALAEGRFPKKSKNSLILLQALKSSSPSAKARAQDTVKHLAENTSASLSERQEQRLFEEITDLETQEVTLKTSEEVASEARTVTIAADIQNEASDISVNQGSWEVEAAPKKVVEEIKRIESLQYDLARRSNGMARELDQLRRNPDSDKVQIATLEQDLKSLDQENGKLLDELKEPKKEWLNYMRRQKARFNQLEYYFKKFGVDVSTSQRIRMWLITLAKGEETENDKTSLKIKGLKVNPDTGKATKEECFIQIKGINFEQPDADNPDSTGDIIIEYIDEEGQLRKADYKMFFQFISGFEGYEEINDLGELNKRIGKNTGYKELAAGQEFYKKVLVGHDEEGNEIHEKQTFKIAEINQQNGKIKLDKVVTKIPRESMQLVVDDRLYFDRHAQDFNYGEFSKFLIQQKYKLAAGIDDAQEMADKSVKATTEQCEEFIEGADKESKAFYLKSLKDEEGKLDVPTQPGQSQEVIFLDENDQMRWGILSAEAENGNQEFVLREKRPNQFIRGDASIPNLRRLGIPANMAGAYRARDAWRNLNANPDKQGNYPAKKRKLSPVELAEMRGLGIINNAPATRPTEGGRWVVNNAPNAIAAMSDASKHAHSDSGAHSPAHGGHADQPQAHHVVQNPADTGHQADHASAAGHGHGEHDAHGAHGEHDAHGDHGAHGHGGHDDHGHGGHDDHGHGDHGHGAHGHDTSKYPAEALAYDAIYKSGGFKRPETNFLKSLWVNTKFLSPSDIWTMGESMIEYYEKQFDRNQKDRFARVGEEIPYFAPEMRRIIEATEHEAVHHFQEALEHKGIYEIRGRLRVTSNKDEFKACLEVLSGKGEMRWDDVQFWGNINKFTKAQFSVPIPGNGDPYTHISPTDATTGFDYIKDALDSIWGEGAYNGWFSKNKSAFSSNSKGFFEEGDQLESKEGGHGDRLAQLLLAHKEDHYVNPHEYEGLIHHMIENGKSTMQAKIYYIVEGVTAQNGAGETLLSFDRIGHFNSQHLAKFPILEYMTAGVPRPPDGKKNHKWTLEDYRSWASMFDGGNPKNCVPNKRVDDFMWNYIIPSDQTQDRINKALRSAENIDHDDMFAYIPPADEEGITKICGTSTGNKQYLTTEGYANVFPGFSQYMRTLAATGKKEKLRKALRSYVRFEGIMTKKYDKANKAFTRLDRTKLGEATIVSTTAPKVFIKEMNDAVKVIVENYNNQFHDADTQELEKLAAIIYDPRAAELDIIDSPDDITKQKALDSAFNKFGKVFEKVTAKDKGQIMTDTISQAEFYGMPDFVTETEKNRRKANKSTQAKDELALE